MQLTSVDKVILLNKFVAAPMQKLNMTFSLLQVTLFRNVSPCYIQNLMSAALDSLKFLCSMEFRVQHRHVTPMCA